MTAQLVPKQPKRKRQPTAACMREQLAMAADTIIELRERLAIARTASSTYREPYWRSRKSRRLAKIAETPLAELPAWARIIRAFQRKS